MSRVFRQQFVTVQPFSLPLVGCFSSCWQTGYLGSADAVGALTLKSLRHLSNTACHCERRPTLPHLGRLLKLLMLSGDALADTRWTDMRRRCYLQGFPRLRSERTVSFGYCFRIMVFPFPALGRKRFKFNQHGPAVTDQCKCQSNTSPAPAWRCLPNEESKWKSLQMIMSSKQWYTLFYWQTFIVYNI